MEELKDLIRDLITEVQGLREDLRTTASAIYNLDDIYKAINELGDTITEGISVLGDTITGPLNYNLQDINARLEAIDQSVVANGV